MMKKLQKPKKPPRVGAGVKGLELNRSPILEPWNLSPGGDLRHFVVEGIMLCYVVLCFVMSCYVMFCSVKLCSVMLCYVMLCMLCMYYNVM